MALDLKPYEKTQWTPTMPITDSRMNNLENGVYVNREALESLDTAVTNNDTSLASINSGIGSNTVPNYSGKTLWDAIATLYNTIAAATDDSTSGRQAWTQIVDLIGKNSLGNLNKSLKEYLNDTYTIEDTSIRKALGTVLDKNGQETYVYKGEGSSKHTVYEDIKFINDALGYDASGTPVFGNKDSEDNTVTVLGTMNKLSDNIDTVLTALKEAAPEPLYSSLANRLAIVDQKIKNATDALELAKSSDTNSTEYGSLDARLETIEGEIINTQTTAAESKTELNTAISTKINISDIENNLNTLDSTKDHVLDARQGRVIKELLYNTTDTAFTNADTVASRISGVNDRVNTLNTQLGTNNYGEGNTITDDINSRIKKSNIYNNLDYVPAQDLAVTEHKVLDAAQGKALKDLIDSTDKAYKEADTTLDNRLDAIETEISDARPQVGTDEESGEPIYGTLDKRLDDIESTATQIRNDVNTIAGELAMVDEATHSIKNNGTRIDIITDEINAAHRAVEEGEPADTLNARFTDLEAKISHPAENEDAGGLTERLTSLENIITDEEDGLAATKAIADANKAAIGDDNSGLIQRIKRLEDEPKSATVVIDNVTYNNDGIPTSISDPSTDVDYLLKNGDKYYYWKYIALDTDPITYVWALISNGNSGTGSSSWEFIPSLSVFEGENVKVPDKNVDYFVGNNQTGYTHYRYIAEDEGGSFVAILPKSLVQNINVKQVNITTADAVGTNEATVQAMSGGLEGYTVDDSSHENNLFKNFVALRWARVKPIYDTDGKTLKSQQLIFTDTDGHDMDPINIEGGGGSGSTQTIRFINESASLNFVVPDLSTTVVNLQARPQIYFGSEIDTSFSSQIDVIVQYRANNNDPWVNYTIINNIQNNTSFTTPDISSILPVGTPMQVRLYLITTIDETQRTSSIIYNITKVEMSIAAINFNQAAIRNTDFNFAYILTGSGLTKEVHFEVDGTDVVTPIITTSHNDRLTQSIPTDNLKNGMHKLQVYFRVNGQNSNILNYYFIYNTDTTRIAPLVALAAENEMITYGDELIINYTVASASSTITTTDKVELTLYAMENGQEKEYSSTSKTNIKNNTIEKWSPSLYPTSGKAYVRITASHIVNDVTYSTSEIITIQINALVIPSEYKYGYAGLDNLVYSYSAYGRTNNDEDKELYICPFEAETADGSKTTINWKGEFKNFNWAGNGYIDGENALTISGDAYHTINVPIFQNTITTSDGKVAYISADRTVSRLTTVGRTIELEYEVVTAADLNATIIDCMLDGVGFKVTPQSCYLLGSGMAATFIDGDNSGFIVNESDIPAAYLTPGVRTHLTFVIEPEATTLAYDKKYHQSVNIYVNGEFANACPYSKIGEQVTNFSTNATLRIGNSNCVIKLYQVKMYNIGLNHKEVLSNYKMAPPIILDKLTRYEENNVLNDDELIDYNKAIKKYNCLLLVGPEPKYGITTSGERIVTNPTVSPYKGYPSPAKRTDKKTGETVGKTESGLILTKPNVNTPEGYTVEFDLRDVIPTDQNIQIPSYLGDRGAYCSSNNVQGTSSQKYPIHNLKIYLAKWNKIYTRDQVIEEGTEIPEGTKTEVVTYKHVPHDNDDGYDLVEVEEGETLSDGTATEQVTYSLKYTTGEIKKVKYSLHGYDENGEALGSTESTLCWKADYMSTDHANTYNANIADDLFPTEPLKGASWGSTHQNTVNGIRCLLFQQQGANGKIVFIGDGCLNNDKGNNKTYSLERKGDDDPADGNDTASQKFEFTNNSDDLGYFKTDTLNKVIGVTKYIVSTAQATIEETEIPQGVTVEELPVGERAPSGDKEVTEEVYNATTPGISYAKETIISQREDSTDITDTITTITYYQLTASKSTKVEGHIQAEDAFESTYPDQGDLEDGGHEPNYNHLQVLLTWVSKRANYWDETDASKREQKKSIFRNEFTKHINLSHALVYYLFCEYTAMCDNRVKNMFFRTDNCRLEKIYNTTGDLILDGNNEPSALWSNYVKEDGTTDATYIDWTRDTFCEWAPVLYDLDSCFGVENVGYIRIRYDAEWDYKWNGLPQFNGYESRLWLMFADTFNDEIRAYAKKLYDMSGGLNYVNFYNAQIRDNLNSISPALSNQDMLLKFDAPWATGFINYALAEPKKETPEYKYLQRGSRAAQKTQFLSMRSKLLSSKYDANEFKNDAIKFRTGVPVGVAGEIIGYSDQTGEISTVQDDTHTTPVYSGTGDLTLTKITVVPNQVFYPGIMYGDNKEPTHYLQNGGKAQPNESCDIQATSAVQGNDGLFICGASALTDIGDISRFCPYQLDLGAGINLKRLIVGSHREGYINNATNGFSNLDKCSLLEEVNIENCIALSSIDLSNIRLIKKIYAIGSAVQTIQLPNGGVLETVEFGAQTNNITIRNQSRFNSFIHEDSANYANLRTLHIENTPNIPVVDIINKTISNLTGGIRLIGIDIDLYPKDATEEENEAALTTTTLFLNTIASTLAKGKRLNSDGTLDSNTARYPEITGKVHITAIRASLLNQLKTLYPDLIIYTTITGSGTVEVNTITEYTINYYNYNYTSSLTDEQKEACLLYTDHRTGNEHYIDPVYDTNPITGNKYISMPEKPSDAQFQYLFGTYNNSNNYIRYSGWKKYGSDSNPKATDYVSGKTDFVAQYPTVITQTYTATWYDTDNTVIYSLPDIPYGQDISSIAPETFASGVTGYFEKTKFDGNKNVYKVFKGWNRPIGVITGNTNIYAQWQISNIDNATRGSGENGAYTAAEFESLTAADLYAISQLGSEAKGILLEDSLTDLNPIAITMGHDFDFTEGVTTTNLMGTADKFTFTGDIDAETKIYDGTHGGLSNIRPLSTNSNWTLAIDYKIIIDTAFKDSQADEFVLASCYKEANENIQGFKLSLRRSAQTTDTNQPIYISWGTDSEIVDYIIVDPNSNEDRQYSQSFRNMLVLEHNVSAPETLRVYHSGHYGINYGTNIGITELTWNNNATIDTPLIFGGNYNYASANLAIESNNSRTVAPGVIYWAKFWNEDLGELNCQRLASWTHEKEYFYLSGYDNNTGNTRTSRRLINDTSLNFSAAQGFGDRYYPSNTGFNYDSNANICGWINSYVRTFCNTRLYNGLPTEYQSILKQTEISSLIYNNSTQAEDKSTTYDYIYLPGEIEVVSEMPTNTNKKNEALHKWPWLVASDYKTLVIGSTSTTLVDSTASSINPWLIRFNGKMISSTARIFRIDADPSSRTWSYNGTFINVQSGDIWITSNGVGYMYYTNNEIAEEGVYADKTTTNGGWKKADIWELRTYSLELMVMAAYGFEKIGDDGALIIAPNRNSPVAGNGRLLCPEFSI